MRSSLPIMVALTSAALTSCNSGTPSSPAAAASNAPPPSAPQQVPAGDWPAYNRTLAGDRFSPLDEIDRGNVAQLKVSAAYTLPEVTALQTGPMVVDGAMFFTSDTSSYAIDASNCGEMEASTESAPSISA